MIGLFVASCLLAVVSWYTTYLGMALYLSTWFALLASLGVQVALVLVAWLIGFARAGRALLIAVYAVTAVISIAFSYVSLYKWFSERERPAIVQRQLYDRLNLAADGAQQQLAAAVAEAEKHALALEEMAQTERAVGHIARAEDADPYLNAIRQAVAREASTYSNQYPEGAGAGVRYTAFDRHSKIARQSLERIRSGQQRLVEFQSRLRPTDSAENQLRAYRRAYDSIAWTDVEQALHNAEFTRPAVPNLTEFVDKTASGQEELLLAFQELVTAPNGRNAFALALATFIDVIVFLVAFAAGPHFFGAVERRWISAGAAVDTLDDQMFIHGFVRKLRPTSRGLVRVEAQDLSPGEQQLCLLLVTKGRATVSGEGQTLGYVLEPTIHEELLDSLADQRVRWKTAAERAPAA